MRFTCVRGTGFWCWVCGGFFAVWWAAGLSGGGNSLDLSQEGQQGNVVRVWEGVRGGYGTGSGISKAVGLRLEKLAETKGGEKGGEKGALFERLSPERTGITHVNPIDIKHKDKYLYASAMAAGGVAIGDVNGDGRPDIFLASGPRNNSLYLQEKGGDFKFRNVAKAAGVEAEGKWATGVGMVDVNGDGKLDIYVCNYLQANQLFINNGDGTFTEKAKAYGVDFVDASHTPTFADYDNDGDVDLYLLTNRWYWNKPSPGSREAFRITGSGPVVVDKYKRYFDAVKTGPAYYELMVVGRPDRLLRNDGGKFTDVTKEAGIVGRGHGLSATWFDVNLDGHIDLYVGNDFDDHDKLYINQGDGTFKESIKRWVAHTSWFSMGADFGDINNDGLFDFVIADMFGTTHYKQKTQMGAMGAKKYFMSTALPRQLMRNHVFVNSGTERWLEAGFMSGLAKSDWTWAMKLHDFDNDSRVDCLITNGMSRNFNEKDDPRALRKTPGVYKTQWDRYEHLPPMKEANLAFRNLGDYQFENVSKAWGFDQPGMSYGAATGDLNGDGHLDMVVVNLDEETRVYKNRGGRGNRVVIRLEGTKSNHQGIGATVTIRTKGGGIQRRQLTVMRGYMSGDEAIVHFGLGKSKVIEELVVDWPSGHRQKFEDVAVNHRVTVTEPGSTPDKRERNVGFAKVKRLFRASGALKGVKHVDRYFDDFHRQLLLPYQHSQLGPGIAVGDVDGDGDEDVYLGGATGMPGRLFLNEGSSKFRWVPIGAFFADRQMEDMGVVFFDADRDGDLDLYVGSGSVESYAGAPVFRDRLYLNDGEGGFSKAGKSALPDLKDSTSTVAAADFDRDGDLDLFVGSRVIPGKYPLSPQSRLLVNDGKGNFSDGTKKLAPGLLKAGLVTSAVWSDADGDKDVDLLLAVEWGPVRYFANEDGKLVERTKEAKLDKWLGWWNGIAAGDVDGDGDMDYVVTNWGLNTKYHASQGHPAKLYYGDFNKNGKMTLVEAEYEGKTLYPGRGKSCSTNAHPHLADKFKTFHKFALSPLKDVYSDKSLSGAHKFEMNTLETGIMVNDGKGGFTFKALPRAAQMSPGYGVVVTDANGDGAQDIYLVQNLKTAQIETGWMAGSLSTLLAGDGKGGFKAVWPNRSGLMVGGDAKGLAVTDLNGDGRPDFIATQNHDEVKAFENASGSKGHVAVRLVGGPGNPTQVGSRITVVGTDGSKQTAEVYAGGGYLSQSSGTKYFGLKEGVDVKYVKVVWPGGKFGTVWPEKGERVIVVGGKEGK